MGHGKIALELIKDERSRNATFRARKNCLVKKASQLSVLCDIDICIIIYGPKIGNRRPVVAETWPRDPEEVRRIVTRYRNSEVDRHPKRNLVLSDIVEVPKKPVLAVAEPVMARKQKPVQVLGDPVMVGKYPAWDDRIDHFSEDQVVALLDKLISKIEDTRIRIQSKENQHVKEITEADKEEEEEPEVISEESSPAQPIQEVNLNPRLLSFRLPDYSASGQGPQMLNSDMNPHGWPMMMMMMMNADPCTQPGGSSSSNFQFIPVPYYAPTAYAWPENSIVCNPTMQPWQPYMQRPVSLPTPSLSSQVHTSQVNIANGKDNV